MVGIDIGFIPGDASRYGSREPAGLFKPVRRKFGMTTSVFGRGWHNAFGGLGVGDSSTFLGDLGIFNPLYVPMWLQALMKRAVMPRIALIILAASLRERRYVLTDSSQENIEFHNSWLRDLFPRILKHAGDAIWYGWKPFIIDWGMRAGAIVPVRARDQAPDGVEAARDDWGEFCGVFLGDEFLDFHRCLCLTWGEESGDPYGTAQALTVAPYWYGWSILMVDMMRYYSRSVDPARIAQAKNIAVATGADSTGVISYQDLTEVVAEAFDALGNGASACLPMDKDGNPLVKFDTLDIPDRADTYLKAVAYFEEKQFVGTNILPGIGVASEFGSMTGQDARISEKTQLSILDFVGAMPEEPLNQLIAIVHRMNKRPGPPPKMKGKPLKREQLDTFKDLFKTAMNTPQPVIGENGRPTGEFYNPASLLKFEELCEYLDLPYHLPKSVAESLEGFEAVQEWFNKGKGGRPEEPLNDVDIQSGGDVSRHEARESGRDR